MLSEPRWTVANDLQQGDTLKPGHEISRKVEYTFNFHAKKLLGTEYLYVSDRRQEDHYRLDHPENEGLFSVTVGYLHSQALIPDRRHPKRLRGHRHDPFENHRSYQNDTRARQIPFLEDHRHSQNYC